MLATLAEHLSILLHMLDRGMKWPLGVIWICSASRCNFVCLVSYWSLGKPHPGIKQLTWHDQQVKSRKLLLKIPNITAQIHMYIPTYINTNIYLMNWNWLKWLPQLPKFFFFFKDSKTVYAILHETVFYTMHYCTRGKSTNATWTGEAHCASIWSSSLPLCRPLSQRSNVCHYSASRVWRVASDERFMATGGVTQVGAQRPHSYFL